MNKGKQLTTAVVDLIRILEKEAGQSLKAKLIRWKGENQEHENLVLMVRTIDTFFGIDDTTKQEVQLLFSTYLRKLFREAKREPESLHEIWRHAGKGVLVRDARTLEPFTLASEFNDGLSVRYILTRINNTSCLMDAHDKNWLVIF